MPRPADIQGSAEFSDETPPLFRHQLDRWWSDLPRALICMANPSYAGADKNDPTIHSLVRLTHSLQGCGGFTVVNWEAYIATSPADLYAWRGRLDTPDLARAIRAENLLRIRRLSTNAYVRMVAWGDIVPFTPHTQQTLLAMSLDRTQDLYAFGFTKSGNPKHPMARGRSRIPDDTQPVLWRAREQEAAA
jgi:hypothetical protein